ncbi:hypothetical protein AAG570_010564 [Ranatra chinensis]|uniref:Uncharacterized protein n=1 Tax=Ranatra chinensis TaxID=642074 RepID=A0ABD0YYW3_9HEMI
MKLIKPTISYLVCPSEKPLEAKQIKPTTSYVMSPSEKPTEAKEIKPTVSYVVCPSEKSLEAKQIKPAVSNVARPSEKPSGSKQTSPTVSYIVRPSEKPLEAKQIKPTVGYVVCPSERSLEAKEIKPTQGYDVRPSEKPLEIKQTKPTVSYAMHPSEKPLNTPCLCPFEKTTCSASTEYAEGAEESTEEIVSSKQEVALSTEAPKSAASTTEVSSKTETTEYHGTEGNKLEQTSEAFKPEPEQENLKPEQGPTTVQNKPEPRPEPEGHKPETEPEPLPSGQGGSEGVGQGEATTPPGHPTQTQGEHDEFGGIGNTQDKGVGPSGGQGKGGGNVGTLSEAPSTQQAPGGNETEPMPETDRASTTPPNELLDLSCKLIHSDPSKSVETVQLKCFQGKKKTVGRHASRHPKRRRNAVRLHGQKFRVGRAIAREHDPHVTTNQKDNEHLRKTISIEIQKKPNELKTQYKKHRKRFGPSEAKKQYDKGTPKGPKRHERFNHFGFDRIIGCSQMTKKTPVHYENYFRPKNTRPYYYE